MDNESTGRHDDAVSQPFDQTNDIAGDVSGESGETAEGDTTNAADREADEGPAFPLLPPGRAGAGGI
jgi:hypothetical protein